jgi:hypothetical protein
LGEPGFMRKVLSFLALVLVSLFTAVGLMLAAPSVAVGDAGHDSAVLALSRVEC